MSAFQIWLTVTDTITELTGLTPATFFTALAVGLTLFYLFALHWFGSNYSSDVNDGFEEKTEPLPPPIPVGEISENELKQYDGSDPKKPLLMAIKGHIYDVSQSRKFYGPYALFAGKDGSRGLAKMSLEEEDLNGDLTGLGEYELQALQYWEHKFMTKYIKVGTLVLQPS